MWLLWLKRLIPSTRVLVIGALIALGAVWGKVIADRMQELGKTVAALSDANTQIEVLRAQNQALNYSLSKSKERTSKLNSLYQQALKATKEVHDACDDVPLPDSFVEQLRLGSDGTHLTVPGPTSELH